MQAADFADCAVSVDLTAVVSAEVERLRTQHADAVREKSAADSKCRKLADKVAALEGEKTDLRGLTCVLQAADFADRAASGAHTAVVSAEVERLRTQHADAVREKSAADSKCRKLANKVAALEGEKADLRRQLASDATC